MAVEDSAEETLEKAKAAIAAADLSDVFNRVRALKEKYARRDERAKSLRHVRDGAYDHVAPDTFTDAYPAPIVANLIDQFCRDFAATVAPLPAFNCASGSMLSEKAKKAAEKRTRIANHYIEVSRLAPQMLEGGDSYAAYGLLAFSVEPDFEENTPRIRVLDGSSVYPLWDRNMRTVAAAQVTHLDRATLEAQYPKSRDAIKGAGAAATLGGKIEVVRWVDKDRCVVYLPMCNNEVLESYANPLGRCHIVAVPRPSSGNAFNGDLRGAYDDLIWPQIARHQFQLLAMEAAEKSVRSPLVVPPDVADVPMGPDAVIRTNNPQGVSKVNIQLPTAAFQSMEQLSHEMRLGAGSPEARSGSISASVITGRGVQQLMEGYSTQIAAAQEMFKFAFQEVIRVCFMWDEKVWPNLVKTVRGMDSGSPFEITYVPSKDIAGDHTIDVQYGFLAGLDANRALVYVLQARGDGLVSREFARRQLPAQINVVEEEKKVQLEQLADSLLQSLSAFAQSIPQQAANGMDPSETVMKVASAMQMLRKGESVDDVVLRAFAPKPPPAPLGPGGAPDQSGQGSGAAGSDPAAGGGQPGGDASGFNFDGLPGNMRLGQEMNPGGRPSLMRLMAGVNGSGGANLGATVMRSRGVAG